MTIHCVWWGVKSTLGDSCSDSLSSSFESQIPSQKLDNIAVGKISTVWGSPQTLKPMPGPRVAQSLLQTFTCDSKEAQTRFTEALMMTKEARKGQLIFKQISFRAVYIFSFLCKIEKIVAIEKGKTWELTVLPFYLTSQTITAHTWLTRGNSVKTNICSGLSKLGQGDGPGGAANVIAWVHPQTPRARRRELIPVGCPLTFTYALWLVYPSDT